MRKKLLLFATVAIAALASCAKTEIRPEVESRDVHFVVNTAENEEVKSFIENNLNGKYTPKWSNGDKLAIFIGTIGDKTKPTGVLENTNPNGITASFGGVVSGISTEGTFKSFAPESAFEKGYSSGNVGINLAESQKPSKLTIDESCDILVAKEASYTADANGVVEVNGLYFKRMFSIVKIALNGPDALNGEKVQKFSLTAPEGTVLAGRAAIDLSTATIKKWNIKNNIVTATYTTDAPTFGDATSSGNVVWLVVNPCTITSGEKVVLAGETAGYTFSKEVTLPKDLVFPQSQLAVINLTLAEENCTKKAEANNFVLHEGELVEGDYLIVYEGKAMKAAVTDKDRLNYADVAVKGTRIENSDESIIWHIAPSAEYWTIFNGNTKSFAASNGTKNQAQLLADGTDDKSLWTVTKTKDDSTFEFVNKANSSATPVVNANLRNNGAVGFACYSTTTGGPLSLYRLDGPVDNTIPSLSVDQSSKVWAADATDAFVVKVTVNSEGGDWTVTPETLSWAKIAVDKTAGTITVTPNDANTAKTANEATLTVTHASDASLTKEISLKQNAAGGETGWSSTYTSNITLSTSGGTKATSAKVKIANTEYSAMKLGSSGNGGNFTISVPAGATKLYLFAAGWNRKTNTITLSGANVSPSDAKTLTADSGVSGNTTTFTINGTPSTYFFEFSFDSSSSAQDIKISCSERCVVWGVNAN